MPSYQMLLENTSESIEHQLSGLRQVRVPPKKGCNGDIRGRAGELNPTQRNPAEVPCPSRIAIHGNTVFLFWLRLR